ncbi:MAG: ABC transporter ATP-binding protein [Clostridia bacterium]|nr:ABC transporter ATP-binding protein [Clostridia bacterium]
MLKADSISKRFGQKIALDRVSLSLDAGHIFGLVGTNGAGKSTMLRVLSGILKPDSGHALLNEADVFENIQAKQQICYISDEPTFVTGATIEDMGSFQSAYYESHDPARLQELCEYFSLPMHERISTVSKGTQKRAQIVLSLARHPRLLLCDETFDGLDPVMRESFKRALGEVMVDEQMTTVLAGHSLQEMENICDSVGFLHEGTLLTSGDMDHILNRFCKLQLVTENGLPQDLLSSLSVVSLRQQGKLSVLTVKGDEAAVLNRLSAANPVYLEAIPLSLEEVFILDMEEQGYAK